MICSKITGIVVDDDKDTAKVFAEYLEIIGIQIVFICHDGKTAVDMYKKHKPDIVFLDLMMPEYDGIYALSEIRKFDQNAKIIVASADLHSVNSSSLALLKPNDVLIKPFDVDKIKIAIEKTIRKQPEIFVEEKKALVSFTITQALLKMGPLATNEVGSRLYAKYRCYFSDCLEHPEYLNETLAETFGSNAKIVTDAIRQSLEELDDQQPISNFLVGLSR